MPTTDLNDLQRQIDALSPAHKLLLAAQLIEDENEGRRDVAVAIAENVVMDYHAAKLFRKRT